MDAEKIRSILESLLFISGDPVPLSRILEILREADKKEVRAALEEMKVRSEEADRGIRLVEVAGGYQLQTPAENAEFVGQLLQTKPVRLTKPALESLAIIAYRQPVTRTEIEELRGVDSGGVLKTLLDHDFIRIVGRKDLPGKPIIYGTTPQFMEFFRLKSLADLPTLKEMEDLQAEMGQPAEEQLILPFDEPGQHQSGSDQTELQESPPQNSADDSAYNERDEISEDLEDEEDEDIPEDEEADEET